MTEYSFTELAECAAREVRMRERVYRRLVQSGEMPDAQAMREIAMMKVIAAKLKAASEQGELFA